MTARIPAAVLVPFLALCMTGGTARAACQMAKAGDLPVAVSNMRALMATKVNGTDETFFIDSGTTYSNISSQVASELKLPHQPAPPNLIVQTIGGQTSFDIATVKQFTIFGIPVSNVSFIAGGSDTGYAGVIGQDYLRVLGDIEYDFANGTVRLWRPKGCGHSDLSYWVTAGQPFSVMKIEEQQDKVVRGTAYVNGTQIRVMFDTGAASSVLSLRAAARAGVKPGDPEVLSVGYGYGAGRQMHEAWIAPFASFKIGDEEIRNTRLFIGETASDVDMQLGFDFFLSHRVYVSNTQGKLYFTYNGGPVFNLTTHSAASPAAASARNPPGTTAPALIQPGSAPAGGEGNGASAAIDQAGPGEPVDAAGYGSRAAVFLQHQDYPHAIADLTRAIQLDPAQPQFLRDRARAYRLSRQPRLARADLDHLLTIKPDDVPALVERARVQLAANEQAAAIADIDAASHAAPKEDASRVEIGQLYQRVNRPQPAIAEYDLWLASHDQDARRPQVLLYRCTARAVWGQELNKALSDCSASLHGFSGPGSVPVLDTRGLVFLRRGDLDKSIKDFSAALKQSPSDGRALYGRGIAKLRKGATADGQADLSAALALQPHVDEEFKSMELAP